MTAVLPLTESEERETREIWDDGSPGSLVARLLATLDAERARHTPPHSRSEAKRLAAQRGETAPVFDAPMCGEPRIPDHIADGAMAVLRGWRNDGADGESAHIVCDYVKQLRSAPPYPASVVEAVRALEAMLKADSDGYALHPGEWREFRSALSALPAGAARSGEEGHMTPEDVRRIRFRIDLAIRYEMGAIPFRHFGPPVSAEVGLALHVGATTALLVRRHYGQWCPLDGHVVRIKVLDALRSARGKR